MTHDSRLTNTNKREASERNSPVAVCELGRGGDREGGEREEEVLTC
jgi:hypothetical protein